MAQPNKTSLTQFSIPLQNTTQYNSNSINRAEKTNTTEDNGTLRHSIAQQETRDAAQVSNVSHARKQQVTKRVKEHENITGQT